MTDLEREGRVWKNHRKKRRVESSSVKKKAKEKEILALISSACLPGLHLGVRSILATMSMVEGMDTRDATGSTQVHAAH